jgi:hypothetical protein
MGTTKIPEMHLALFSPTSNSEEMTDHDERSQDGLRCARGALFAVGLCLPFWAVVAWGVLRLLHF